MRQKASYTNHICMLSIFRSSQVNTAARTLPEKYCNTEKDRSRSKQLKAGPETMYLVRDGRYI